MIIRLFKEIFGRLWALWAICVFISTMIIFMVPFLLFCYFKTDPVKASRFILYSRTWMAVFLTLIGCPLTIKGRQNFEEGKNYIVVCNHNSFMDIPVSSPAIPGGNKTIAKIEMSKIPVFGMLYEAGSVLVDRKDESSRKDSYAKMKKVLDMGLHMCIYPEGSRNRSSDPLKSFHNGAFRLSAGTGKAIIPAVIFNTRKALPPSQFFYAEPHPLSIHFLQAVSPASEESVEHYRDRVHKLMRDYYEKNSNN